MQSTAQHGLPCVCVAPAVHGLTAPSTWIIHLDLHPPNVPRMLICVQDGLGALGDDFGGHDVLALEDMGFDFDK